MKKSLIWIATGAAAIGIGVPVFAATQASKPHPTITTVAPVSQPSTRLDDKGVDATVTSIDDRGNDATVTTMDDRGNDATVTSIDDNGDDATENSIDDDATENSVDDDATENSVEDVSGPCDEAEHANDPRCTGAAPATTADDNPGHEVNGGADDSGHHNGGGDDSGHGGNNG